MIHLSCGLFNYADMVNKKWLFTVIFKIAPPFSQILAALVFYVLFQLDIINVSVGRAIIFAVCLGDADVSKQTGIAIFFTPSE